MAPRPEIKENQWIKVGNLDCIVSVVRDVGDAFGDCEVVFDAKKPTYHDAEWDGQNWVLCKRPDFGGYADRQSRLSEAVRHLRMGRFRT
jgi:hypothetical protein